MATTENEPHAAPKKGGVDHGLFGNFLDELAKEGSELAAATFYKTLSPKMRERLKKQSNLLKLARVIRFLIPGSSPISHASGEFVSDFVSNFQRLVKDGVHPDGTAPEEHAAKTDTPHHETKQQVNHAVKVMIAVSELPEALQQDFMEWYLHDDEHMRGFNELSKHANDEYIRKLASRPKADLSRLIKQLYPPLPPKTETANQETPFKDEWQALTETVDEDTERLEEKLAEIRAETSTPRRGFLGWFRRS